MSLSLFVPHTLLGLLNCTRICQVKPEARGLLYTVNVAAVKKKSSFRVLAISKSYWYSPNFPIISFISFIPYISSSLAILLPIQSITESCQFYLWMSLSVLASCNRHCRVYSSSPHCLSSGRDCFWLVGCLASHLCCLQFTSHLYSPLLPECFQSRFGKSVLEDFVTCKKNPNSLLSSFLHWFLLLSLTVVLWLTVSWHYHAVETMFLFLLLCFVFLMNWHSFFMTPLIGSFLYQEACRMRLWREITYQKHKGNRAIIVYDLVNNLYHCLL